MPISLVQQGLIVQQEFSKFVMMGSGGRLELAPPLTDDERRDFEIHIHGQYGFGLAVQVKSTRILRRIGGKARYLSCSFRVRASRLVNNPLYRYYIAYLDPNLMGLADPTFFVPSAEFHKHAAPVRRGDFWHFTFVASMEPKTRDHWHPWRVNTHDLGKHVLEVMRDLAKRKDLRARWAEIAEVPDILWIRSRDGYRKVAGVWRPAA